MTMPNAEVQNQEIRQVLAGPMSVPAPIPDVLVEKLAAVWAGVERVEKTGRHPQGWKFATESDIADLIRVLCSENGVVLIPNLVQHLEREIGKTSNQNPIHRHDVVIDWTVSAGANATIVRRWRGQADDSSDKGLNKAITACRKTFLISLFQVSSGDDPDQHQPEAPVRQQQVRGTGRDMSTTGVPTERSDPPTEGQLGEYARLKHAIVVIGKVNPDAFDTFLHGWCPENVGGDWGHLNLRQWDAVLDKLREQARKLLGKDVDPVTGELKDIPPEGEKAQAADDALHGRHPAPPAAPDAEKPSEAPTSPDGPAPAPAPQAPDVPAAPPPAPDPAPSEGQPSIPGVHEPGSTITGARDLVKGNIGNEGLMSVIEGLKAAHGTITPNDLDADPLRAEFLTALAAAIDAHSKAAS